MALSFSKAAAQEMQKYLANRGGGLGIRLMVETSECDGMSYRLEFVDKADEYDHMYESHGANIYVDPKSLVYVDGTEIGYSTDGDEGGFAINNPNAKNQCGCGGSFYV
jgi:iron-sulfur cluster assembly protein